ncbi:ectoine hydroxylase [Kushneria sinocarnis]|uniref:Ectoine hydroxylase n=1 Tax=Kushneria sinocarnis TaxID=595502 RepID=A0A420WSH2_9GAMM|nr:ectoine hydroxylase [Kushneria sinocarnis]RKQ95707.1 ectoine hydroxylase [Kushneria sinocarnis]
MAQVNARYNEQKFEQNQREDFYPTRLSEPLGVSWLKRHDEVVRGRHVKGPLSEAQLTEFEKNGFLFIPGFLDEAEVEEYRRELDALLARDDYRNRDFTVTEPSSDEIRSLFAVHFLSQKFHKLTEDPKLVDSVRQILGDDVYVHQSRVNYKPGFEGKGFDWHSDFETWHAEDGMPRMGAISASIVLTDNHEFNGPLMLVPGSHQAFVPSLGETPDDNYKSSLKKQEAGVPSKEVLAKLIERNGIQAPKGKAGGLLLFDCNTMHGSNANMSPDPRSNIFFVFNRRDNAMQEPFGAKKQRPDFLAHTPDQRWRDL